MKQNHLQLYSYWRSSAAYRVRIGLHWKALAFTTKPVHLLHNGGEQHSLIYKNINSQELVPTLVDGSYTLYQSLSILEYLDEAYAGPDILPKDISARIKSRALAQMIACDIHPLNNLRVLQFLENEFNTPRTQREYWIQHWMKIGFEAFEANIKDNAQGTLCCVGNTPTLADMCLIPQVYNAKRYNLDLTPYPTIVRIYQHAVTLPAFIAASPECQPDAPSCNVSI